VYCVESEAVRDTVSVERAAGEGEGMGTLGMYFWGSRKHEIEGLLAALFELKVSGDCRVEVSSVARVDCLTIGVFVRVRLAGIEGVLERSCLEGQWIA